MSLFAELNRRNVLRVTVAYLMSAWLVLQVADVVLNNIAAPGWIFQVLLLLFALGLPFVVAFSWVYELTPNGLERESGVARADTVVAGTARKLDIVVIILLVATIGFFLTNRLLQGGDVADDAAHAGHTEARTDQVPVVAVLPLQALSTADEGRLLAAGLHSDLLTRLARLTAFRVISRTSVMEYADTTKNMRQIGTELGAGYILEGGLQAIGGQVRINAQLIDTATDEHLWAETFDKSLTTANLFEVQADIADAIASALHSALSPQDKRIMREVPTESLDAYQAYIEAKAYDESYSRSRIDALVAGARRAVAIDPRFADAWALLTEGLIKDYWESGGEFDASPDEALRQAAGEALAQAQSLDPNGIETLLATAYYHYYGFRQYALALAELDRAAALAPHNADVIGNRGFLLRRLGRMNEAADALIKARQANPNSAEYLRETISTLRVAGRCREAMELVDVALEKFPRDNYILVDVSNCLQVCQNDTVRSSALLGRLDVTIQYELRSKVTMLINSGNEMDAIDVLNAVEGEWTRSPIMRLTIANYLTWLWRRNGRSDLAESALRDAADATVNLTHTGATALGAMAMTAALRGDAAQSLILGRRAMAAVPNDAYLRPQFRYRVLQAYAVAGLTEDALQALAIMLNEPGGRYIAPLQLDPYLESLRNSPEFQRLLQDRDQRSKTKAEQYCSAGYFYSGQQDWLTPCLTEVQAVQKRVNSATVTARPGTTTLLWPPVHETPD